MSHPVDPLRRALATEPSRPLVTFYDDATGERVEFSARTFDNWVAKTANLLVDGLAAAPGGRVALALPGHWQTAVWLFACWSAGLTALPVGYGVIPADADVVAAGPDRLDAALSAASTGGAAEVVGLSLHSLGAPLADCPPGVTDYAVEVRAYGDHFIPVTHQAPAVEYEGAAVSGPELMARAEAAITSPGARVLTTVAFDTLDGLLAGLLSPLTSGGSVIICQNLEQTRLERRISLEHVTALVPPRLAHPVS
jgi:uncharacterized protein (TIGR03089 family)